MTATASSLAQFMAQHSDDDCLQAWQLMISYRPHLQEKLGSLCLEEPLTRYSGSLSAIDAKRGYGFIVSEQVTLEYGRDTFVSTNETGSFQTGQQIKFSIVTNKSGHPQARLLESSTDGSVPLHIHDVFKSHFQSSEFGQPPAKRGRFENDPQSAQSAQWSPGDTTRYVGTLTSFMPEKRCGFIQCSDLYGQFKKDVFVSQDELHGQQIGDAVSFRLVLNGKGNPQAWEVGSPENVGVPQEQQRQSDSNADTTRYSGTVISFEPDKFCGFIQCAALYDKFKKDVYVGQDELNGYLCGTGGGMEQVGQSVSFRLVTNARGHPQARDLGPPENATDNSADGNSGEERYNGTIQSFLPEKHCGFIHCADLYASYGKDIFVAVDEMGSYQPGSEVSFRLTVNARGMPQARDLGPSTRGSAPQVVKPPQHIAPRVVQPPAAAQKTMQESKRYVGTIQTFIPEKHCGFIQCAETYPIYKKDVFLSEDEFSTFQVGDTISFQLTVSARGHPQARELGPPEATSVQRTEAMEIQTQVIEDDSRRYVGAVESYIAEKHCGFISCQELYPIYKKDVFVSEEELCGFQIGDMVSFRVVLSARGHPQAREVGPADMVSAEDNFGGLSGGLSDGLLY